MIKMSEALPQTTTAYLPPEHERHQKIIRLLLAAKKEPRRAPPNPELIKELRETGHFIIEHPDYPLRNKVILERFGYLLPMSRYQRCFYKVLSIVGLIIFGPIFAITILALVFGGIWSVFEWIMALPYIVATLFVLVVLFGLPIGTIYLVYLLLRKLWH